MAQGTGTTPTRTAAVTEYIESDWNDFRRTGPETLGGRYMRMFWQPVYAADDLQPGRAAPIRIMSEDFTLYRGEGGATHLLAFRCAHRGTQLSTGWVEGDDLRCFYHGWKYAPSGQCIEQPAEPEPFCQKIQIRSYPTEEYVGLIFVYLGEGAPPPFPRYPDMDANKPYEVEMWSWPCNFFNYLDNDPAHGAFVHRPPGQPKGVFYTAQYSFEETEWGMSQTRLWSDGEFRTSHQAMPNIFCNRGPRDTLPKEPVTRWGDDVSWGVPIDDEHFWTVRLKFSPPLGDLPPDEVQRYLEGRAARLQQATVVSHQELARAVLRGELDVHTLVAETQTQRTRVQDYVTQVGQGAISDRVNERLGRTDTGVILIRKLWTQELRALAEGRPLKQWRRPEGLSASNSQGASSFLVHAAAGAA